MRMYADNVSGMSGLSNVSFRAIVRSATQRAIESKLLNMAELARRIGAHRNSVIQFAASGNLGGDRVRALARELMLLGMFTTEELETVTTEIGTTDEPMGGFANVARRYPVGGFIDTINFPDLGMLPSEQRILDTIATAHDAGMTKDEQTLHELRQQIRDIRIEIEALADPIEAIERTYSAIQRRVNDHIQQARRVAEETRIYGHKPKKIINRTDAKK